MLTLQNTERWPKTIADIFTGALARNPGKTALIAPDRRLTYAELDAEIDKAAAALQGLGIGKGDRVAASLDNCTDIVIAFHATARLGAIWVGISCLFAVPEKRYILHDSGSRILLAEDSIITSLKHRRDGLQYVSCSSGTDPDDPWRSMLRTAGAFRPPSGIEPDTPVGIAYTSGTTGRPKGVIHSHRNLLMPGAVQVATRPGYGPDMVKVDFIPLTILNMMVLTTLLVFQAGGTCVLAKTADAEALASLIERERATVFQGVPAVLHNMIVKDAVTRAMLSSLCEVLTGGAATPEPLLAGFRGKFGHSIVGTYGMTEAPTMFAIESPQAVDHAPNASGKALPHIDLFAEGPGGERLAAGETGEICAKPANAGPLAGFYTPMLGYWNRPEATDAVLRNGCVHTGDIGYVDAEGRVFITDRKNLLIIRGGANVYPAEVQRVLASDTRVADSAVFGMPDERLGERVVAAVQLVAGARVTAEELQALCAKELARYKVPERIVFVDAFPRNAMNKVIRAELPKLFAAATTGEEG